MNSIIKSGIVKARKSYTTDGESYFDFAYNHKTKEYDLEEFKSIGMSEEEIQIVLDAKAKNWTIDKGEMYYSQIGRFEGNIYHFQAIKAIHDICVKYDLYEE
jgi:hypothetical protein